LVAVIYRFGCKRALAGSALIDADDAKAVVIGEVVEVLDVESYQRQVADEAARRDPCVVHRPGTAPPGCSPPGAGSG